MRGFPRRLANDRPRVDAGRHILFSFQGPRPRGTQAGRYAVIELL